MENLAGLAAHPSVKDLKNYQWRSEAKYDAVDIEGDMLVHRILFLFRDEDYELTMRFKALRLQMTPHEGGCDAAF